MCCHSKINCIVENGGKFMNNRDIDINKITFDVKRVFL